MAHNINGERFFGYRDAAWHSLGIVSQEPTTGMDALTAIGGGYFFEKRALTCMLNGQPSESGFYSLVRSPAPDDPTERVIDVVTDSYNILQPLDVVEMFDEKVGKPVETLGFLGKGERMFLTWELRNFSTKPDDEVRVFGFVATGFDGKMGANLYVVTVRVVCQNTWMMAVNQAENSDDEDMGVIYRGKHTQKDMGKELGIWMEHVQEQADRKVAAVEENFKLMESVPVERADIHTMSDLLFNIYPYPREMAESYPAELRDKKQKAIDTAYKYAESSQNGVYNLFMGAGTAIDETAYGLFNAVTEYENHARVQRKSPANSVLFGKRGSAMNRANKVITAFCKGESVELAEDDDLIDEE